MKQIYIALVFTLSIVLARAGFVIQQKIESADQNGVQTIKIKDDKIRTDMPTVLLGNVSVIQDLNTGDRILMIHEKKIAKMQSAAEFKQKFAQINGGDNAQTPKLVNTGKTEKVGDYTTEIYTWTNNRDMGGTLWVATNFPDFLKFRGLLKKIHQSPAGEMVKGTQPDTSTLPGITVKSTRETPAGEITLTLISAKEEPIATSNFQIPADYRVVGLPVTTSSPSASDK